jgi:GDPmannose 4,6-dehydratase
MPRALITGICGQDGSYLAELLLARGDTVLGTDRPSAGRERLPPTLAGRVELVAMDLRDRSSIAGAIRHCRPGEVYNLAAVTSGADMFVDPPAIHDLNGQAVARLLDAIREVDPGIRFCQASSSEMFGLAAESPQSESTPFNPRSPYGEAKLFAHEQVVRHRREHGLFACSAILFNHESPRRGPGFVTRKITQGAAMIRRGLATTLVLGNLDARRDWGHARDSVRAMALMLAHGTASDYVVATGRSHAVRDICELAFARVGLDYLDHVQQASADFRAGEQVPLVGDASRALRELGWAPAVGFEELVAEMVDADMARLSADEVKKGMP